MSGGPFRTERGYLFAGAVLAMCSLSYELIFAKIVAEITGNATIWESISMAVFLCGMGVRSLVFRVDAADAMGRRLIWTEIGLIGTAVLSYFLIFIAQVLYRDYVFDAGILRETWDFPPVFLLGGVAQLALFALGWFTAYELQFFLHWSEAPPFRFKESAVLAAYHFGALAGTIGFVAAHRTGVAPFDALCATVVLNLMFALYMMRGLGTWREFRRATVLVMILTAAAAVVERPFEAIVLKNHYNNQFRWEFDAQGLKDVSHPLGPLDFAGSANTVPEVRRIRSPFQVLDMVQDAETGTSSLYINGRFQVGPGSAARYHETFAHVALGYKVGPTRRVLILGGGDGVLAAELLKHRQIESIDMVEIDASVLALAQDDRDLRSLNHGALADPRLVVHREDAMAFVRSRAATYDAVFIDLTYPYDFDSARFFSVEFFRMTARDLLPGGILVAGLPFDMVEPEELGLHATVEATLAAAKFSRFVGYSNGNDHFLVVGKDELAADYKIAPDLQLTILPTLKIKTTSVSAPRAGGSVLTVMRPKLLMIYDSFY